MGERDARTEASYGNLRLEKMGQERSPPPSLAHTPDASHPASRPPLGADSHHPSLVDMSYRLTQISMLMRTMMIHSSVSDLRFCKISR